MCLEKNKILFSWFSLVTFGFEPVIFLRHFEEARNIQTCVVQIPSKGLFVSVIGISYASLTKDKNIIIIVIIIMHSQNNISNGCFPYISSVQFSVCRSHGRSTC